MSKNASNRRAARPQAAPERARIERLRNFNRDIAKVTKALQGAALNFVLVGDDDMIPLALAALSGSPTAMALARLIEHWLAHNARARDPLECPRCLGCETSFGPNNPTPRGFAAALGFANYDAGVVTGICGQCCMRGHEELTRLFVELQRRVWPDAYVARNSGGHA